MLYCSNPQLYLMVLCSCVVMLYCSRPNPQHFLVMERDTKQDTETATEDSEIVMESDRTKEDQTGQRDSYRILYDGELPQKRQRHTKTRLIK